MPADQEQRLHLQELQDHQEDVAVPAWQRMTASMKAEQVREMKEELVEMMEQGLHHQEQGMEAAPLLIEVVQLEAEEWKVTWS